MTKSYCKNHRQARGRWHCPSCRADLCPRCVEAASPGAAAPTCSSCGEAVVSRGAEAIVPRFWQRIPQLLAYPARLDALGFITAMSIASLLVFLPVLGLLVYLVVTYALLKYGYVVLSHTARGNLSPPQLLGQQYEETRYLPLKQLVVFLVMGLAVLGAGLLSPLLALIALLFVMFAIPASTMSMALSGSIAEAVSPAVLFGVMRRIGAGYLLLYVFLILTSGASSTVQLMLGASAPPWAAMMGTTFVSGYFTVMMFHMMGYVVYQYHRELGFDGVREYEETAATRTAPSPGTTAGAGPKGSARVDPLHAEVEALADEGKLEEALQRLRRRAEGPAGSLDDRARYHQLLVRAGEAGPLCDHAGAYIRALAHNQQPGEALQVYADCLRADPAFRVKDARLTYALARSAHVAGKHDLALQMLNRFAKVFPQHEVSPEAFFLAAKLLCEHKGQDAKAMSILDGLLRQYAGHPLVAEIEQYRAFVGKLSGESGLAKAG